MKVKVVFEFSQHQGVFKARFIYEYKKGGFYDIGEIVSPIEDKSKRILERSAIRILSEILDDERFLESPFYIIDETHLVKDSSVSSIDQYLNKIAGEKPKSCHIKS